VKTEIALYQSLPIGNGVALALLAGGFGYQRLRHPGCLLAALCGFVLLLHSCSCAWLRTVGRRSCSCIAASSRRQRVGLRVLAYSMHPRWAQVSEACC
jgi:hypothetical protein